MRSARPRRGWFVRLTCLCAATIVALLSLAAGRAATGALSWGLIGSAQAADQAAPAFKHGAILIEAPWARATPGGAQVAGGYLKITNTGEDADRLLGGTLPVAASVEVHEMSMSNGVMKMRKLEQGLEIKPGQSVELKPGGYHLMFNGLKEGLQQGQSIKGTLTFEKAGSIEVEYSVAAIGAQQPGGGYSHH
jgi:periplasmic copper chaperone A